MGPAYLCGQDPLTGTDYEHRPGLIRQRMEFLAGVMEIEVLGYAILSNHFHCVLRSRHDVVARFTVSAKNRTKQGGWLLHSQSAFTVRIRVGPDAVRCRSFGG